MNKVDLKVDFCSYQAAKFAVEHWHYSKTMPKSKLNMFGAWENDAFIGSVVYGVGATADMVKQFGLDKWEGCELVRIALTAHKSPVSQIVSRTFGLLTKHNQGLRLLVSYADPEHGHAGGIYQAMNWTYTGLTMASDEYIVNGKRWHGRAFRASKPDHLTTKQYLDLIGNYQIVKGSSKYRYVYPLDRAMRRQIAPLAKPYPKKDAPLVNGDSVATSHAGRFDPDPEALEETAVTA